MTLTRVWPNGATDLEDLTDVVVSGAARGHILAHDGNDFRNRSQGVVDVRDWGAAGDGATDDTAAIQAAITAVPSNATVVFSGSFKLTGAITLSGKSNVTLDFRQATIAQTGSLVRTLVITGCTGVTVLGGRWNGLGTDYVNTSTVYAACAIDIQGASTDILIRDAVMLNFAGGGVSCQSTTAARIHVRDCRIAGPGPARITPLTDNFSAGILFFGAGFNDWSVVGCDISGYAQGIITPVYTTNFRIAGNAIHDITGQHGMYFSGVGHGAIAGNIVRATGLQGLKVQLVAGYQDATDLTISGNVFTALGSHAILLTHTGTVANPERIRRITIVGNVINGTANGDGINGKLVDGVLIADNLMNDVRVGVNITTSNALTIIGNRIRQADWQGIALDATTESSILDNTILDPGQANNAPTEFGVYVSGASSAIDVRRNRVLDTLGNMSYGIYLNPTDSSTFAVTGNFSAGATGHGMRFAAAGPIREYRDNDVGGTAGRVLNPPATGFGLKARHEFGTAAPVSGTYFQGDVVWNTTPVAAGTMGWVCTTTGTPGTWRTWGTIAP